MDKRATTPQPNELVSQINNLLQANVDPAYLTKIVKLVPSNETIIGVRVPKIKELAQSFHQTNAIAFVPCVDLLDQLFQRQIRDEILFGIFLLEKHKSLFSTKLFANVDGWIAYIENWEVCDQLASRVSGEIVARDLTLLAKLLEWTQSDHLWRRRSALAVTSALNQKGRSHVEETLKVTEKVMNDEERMVQKAVSWTLKEASKKDERQVFDYLMKWKDKANPRIIKEGAEKLSPELRAELFQD